MSLTKEQWANDPNLRQGLASLLQDPILQIALEIVRDQELNPLTHAGGDLVQWYALMGAKRMGYLEALKNLRHLAEVTSKPQVEPKAWEGGSPPGPPKNV